MILGAVRLPTRARLLTSSFMTSEYEKQRELNISKNKELLNGLALSKPKEPPKVTKIETRPAKRQKLNPAVATRTSSRLSSQPKPTYVEDQFPKEQASPIVKTKRFASKQKELTEAEVQEVVQRWAWEAAADPPIVGENGTLHFNDHPDVLPPSVILILVSSQSYTRRDFTARIIRRLILSSRLLKNSINENPTRLL